MHLNSLSNKMLTMLSWILMNESWRQQCWLIKYKYRWKPLIKSKTEYAFSSTALRTSSFQLPSTTMGRCTNITKFIYFLFLSLNFIFIVICKTRFIFMRMWPSSTVWIDWRNGRILFYFDYHSHHHHPNVGRRYWTLNMFQHFFFRLHFFRLSHVFNALMNQLVGICDLNFFSASWAIRSGNGFYVFIIR